MKKYTHVMYRTTSHEDGFEYKIIKLIFQISGIRIG